MHAVNSMAWITRPNPKQLAVPMSIKDGNFSAEVSQDCLDNSLAGLPLTQALAGVFEVPQKLRR